MFERYTESARRALFFARYEVTQVGGTSIDTEHLLLGLIRELKGLVARIFAERNVPPETVRQAIEARLVVRERISTSVEVPFSAETKRALQYSAEESDRMGHSYIGTEHLLLGLLREQNSAAAAILTAHGLRLDEVRIAIVKLLREPSPADDLGNLQAFERVTLIRRLVQELEQLASDSDKARQLVHQIDSTLSALMRQFPR